VVEKIDFHTVFSGLKQILGPYANNLVIKNDEIDEFYLDTNFTMKNKKPMYFGSVKINKKYVSFHLMPVYIFPGLLKNISPQLKRRMQGKSCFNFTSVDPALFQELNDLTRQGYNRYGEEGYL